MSGLIKHASIGFFAASLYVASLGANAQTADEVVLNIAIPTLGTMDFSPVTGDQDNEKWLALIGNGLVGLNRETAKFAPELAESWTVNEDGTEWTFKLRPNVKFHDGWGTVTADDVKFSWEQWIAEDSTHSARKIYRQAVGEDIKNFEIINDLEFKLKSGKPVHHLLAALCSCEPGVTVFPRKYYEEKGEEAIKHPIGTNAFKYLSHKDGEELVLEKFDEYWGDPAKVDRVVIKEIPDGAARLTQVQAGAIDLAQLDGSLVGEAEASGLKILGIPAVRNAFIFLGGSYWTMPDQLDKASPWIQADSPEKGKAIREAMSLAIDRQAILDVALGGHGTLSYGPVVANPLNSDLIDPSWELPKYDPELAKQKLAEGGYPDGFEVNMPLFGDDFDTEAMGEMIADMWEAIGLKVTRSPMDGDTLESKENAFETEGLAWVGTVSMAPEPARPLFSYTTKTFDQGSIKMFHKSIDDAYAKLTAQPVEAERRKITREMIAALKDEYIYLTLMAGDMLFMAGPRFADWKPTPTVNAINSLETISLNP
jgi:peptide/nickel transport system substrate-binding protein